MSKAFIITYTLSTSQGDGEPQTLCVAFSKEEAEKIKLNDMRDHRAHAEENNIFSYNEDNGLIVYNEGTVTAIQWNIEETEAVSQKETGQRDNKNEEKPSYTGWYAVVHFGKDEKDGVPCYLRKIPYKDWQGVEHTTYWHFTTDLRDTELFSNTYDADMARMQVEKALAEKNHCLAGHVKVMEIRGLVRESGKEAL